MSSNHVKDVDTFPLLTTRTKLAWVAILYFAQGLPVGLPFSVYFRAHGMSLEEIGLLSLTGLPWALKFVWAPAVDLRGKRRTWIVVCQGLLALNICLLLACDPTRLTSLSWALLIALPFLSATQDIAIDAYTIELLNEEEIGPANGIRVTTYRLALICTGGVFVALAGLVGWAVAFVGAALVLAASAVLSSRAPELTRPRPRLADWEKEETCQQGSWSWRTRFLFAELRRVCIGPLQSFWQRPGMVYVGLFILSFKLGDMALGPMVGPFWVDRGFTLVQIGTVPGTLGVVATILGALLGGKLTQSWGLFRALWILGAAQAASNLVYAAAAALPPSAALMYTASVVESFCGGLGTAPFLAFLMYICDKSRAATQYALLSALFGLSRSVSGAFSGVLAESLGYAAYFTATFFLAWPAFLLLPWVRKWIRQRRAEESAGAESSGA